MNLKENELTALVAEQNIFEMEQKKQSNKYAEEIKNGLGDEIKEYLKKPIQKETFCQKLRRLWRRK